MFGLLLLYWIGKRFYKLAEEYKRSEWGFAILGIAVYYGTIFFFSFFIGVFGEIISPGYFETVNELLFGILMLPLGILSCFILYKYLEKRWKKTTINPVDLIDDFGEVEE